MVKMHCCAWDDVVFFDFEEEHPFVFNEDKKITLREIEFNLTAKTYTMKTLVPDMACEFPVINPNLVGHWHRYVYVACVPVVGKYPDCFTQKVKESAQFTGFLKYDTQYNKIEHHVSYGGDKMAGEVIFHPRIYSREP